MSVDLGIYEKAMPESFSFKEKLALARRAGFDYLEISIDESDKKLSRVFDASTRREFVNAAKNSDIRVKTMCLSGHRRFPLGSHDAETRRKSLELMQAAIDFALDAGVRIIAIGDSIDYPTHDDWTNIRLRFLLNEMPVTDSSQKVKSVIQRRQQDGKWVCSVPMAT